MQIHTIGVVGCGLMGSGVARVCAQAGIRTIISEASQELLDRGMARIEAALARDQERGRVDDETAARVRHNLQPAADLSTLASCQVVIEAIVENLAAKRELFARLDAICPPDTIFASNTSSIPIVQIATATQRPDRCAGLHFFNPVPVMGLVEVVRAITSSDTTIAVLKELGAALGKRVVEAKDTPGFIVNRLLIPYLLDAVRLLEAGAAARDDIDAGMQLGCNHPMGPLRLLDFVGLDTAYYIAEIMYDEFKEPRFAPPPLLKQLVQAGYLGKKSGRGFYTY